MNLDRKDVARDLWGKSTDNLWWRPKKGKENEIRSFRLLYRLRVSIYLKLNHLVFVINFLPSKKNAFPSLSPLTDSLMKTSNAMSGLDTFYLSKINFISHSMWRKLSVLLSFHRQPQKKRRTEAKKRRKKTSKRAIFSFFFEIKLAFFPFFSSRFSLGSSIFSPIVKWEDW